MSFIKFLVTFLALIFGVMLVFWLFGFVYSLLWYAFWLAVLGTAAYGGYKLFQGATGRLGGKKQKEIEQFRDFDLSWDEYSKKYLHK